MYHNDPRESEDAGGSPRMPLKALAAVIGYAIMQPAFYSSRFTHLSLTNIVCGGLNEAVILCFCF